MMDEVERPSRVGEVLAEKYRITRFLGDGGMGTVYEAQHAVVGRRFAVKFLHAELALEGNILERFKREAQAAGALENENIASVIDFGQASDGIPYIVMEFLIGEDLAKLLAREGRLPVARAVNMIMQACRGLDAAHAAGVVHRDLKPENLFVCRRGDGSDLVKLLDFGIAKLGQVGGAGPVESMTLSGATMGTPFYMPPEQARGDKDLDHRADIYSMGVILYEVLSGQKPHPGDSYNSILYHILTQPAAPLGSLRDGLDADLTDVVHRALSFEPADRPSSAMELARAVSRHAGRQLTPMQSQFELRAVTQESQPAQAEATPTPPGMIQPGHTALLMDERAPEFAGVRAAPATRTPHKRNTATASRVPTTRPRFRRSVIAVSALAATTLAIVAGVWLVRGRNDEPLTTDDMTPGFHSVEGVRAADKSAPNEQGPPLSPPSSTPSAATSSQTTEAGDVAATGGPAIVAPGIASGGADASREDTVAASESARVAATTGNARPRAPSARRQPRKGADGRAFSPPPPAFDKTNPYR